MSTYDKLPEEMQIAMCHAAVEQGNDFFEADVIFKNGLYACKKTGGFTWDETPEGHEWWATLIKAAEKGNDDMEVLWKNAIDRLNDESYDIIEI